MIKQFRERRQCRSYAPYLFFTFELIIYSELAYLIYSILGEGRLTLIAITLVLSYQLFKSFKRLVSVKRRCKGAEVYNKYKQKAQENDMRKNISF